MKPALSIAIAAAPLIALGAYFHFQNVAFNERNAAKEQALASDRRSEAEPVPVPPQAPSDQKQATKTTGNATPLALPSVLEKVPPPETANDTTSQDEKKYIDEINLNLKRAKINNIHFKEIESELEEAAGLSATERAKSPVIADARATAKEAAHFVDLAGCLNDQRKRGVGYYQGKSTCAAMFPG
ncbi:MAG: hypothetical protein NTW51_04925 [Cyanobacteria bacterium]|nr:hypothetical protein [Cyanobacteriota bacterium]